jgi:hypothetical protein
MRGVQIHKRWLDQCAIASFTGIQSERTHSVNGYVGVRQDSTGFLGGFRNEVGL